MKRAYQRGDYQVDNLILRVNGVVETQRVWATHFSLLVATMRPRPETDYAKPTGCPRCGKVYHQPQKPPALQECRCPGLLNAGIRLKGREEMLWWADVWAALGYPDAANMREIALKLPANNLHVG